MSYFVMVAQGLANGQPSPFDGWYLQSFNPDANFGFGDGVWTQDIIKAQKFKDAGEAMALWKQASTVLPRRPDGKPNRPLTAMTVEIRKMDSPHRIHPTEE